MERSVVITGIGVLSAAGQTPAAVWDAVDQGASAVAPITPERGGFDATGLGSGLGAVVEGFDARKVVPKHYRKATKVMARDTELAVGAAALAAESAGLITRASESEDEPTFGALRLGCSIGAGLIATEPEELGMAGAATAAEAGGGFDAAEWGVKGMAALQPLWMLKYLPNMLACHVTILHGAEGPSNTITCSEASGLLSLGESVRIIARGDADACFAGGGESKINALAMGRYSHSGRLAKDEAVVPFSEESSGCAIGEAAGLVITEAAESATSRGARVLAEVLGFGAAQSPPPFFGLKIGPEAEMPEVDRGVTRSVERALEDAGVSAGDIDAVIPHGSGVWSVDRAELGGLRAVFGDRLDTASESELPLVRWAHIAGECVAGNAGVQLALAIETLSRGKAPGFDREGLKTVLVCTNAMGGQNAAVVLRLPG